MCEYSGVKPVCIMKVNVVSDDLGANASAASTDPDSLMIDLSMSIYAGTRKMVNYA